MKLYSFVVKLSKMTRLETHLKFFTAHLLRNIDLYRFSLVLLLYHNKNIADSQPTFHLTGQWLLTDIFLLKKE